MAQCLGTVGGRWIKAHAAGARILLCRGNNGARIGGEAHQDRATTVAVSSHVPKAGRFRISRARITHIPTVFPDDSVRRSIDVDSTHAHLVGITRKLIVETPQPAYEVEHLGVAPLPPRQHGQASQRIGDQVFSPPTLYELTH